MLERRGRELIGVALVVAALLFALMLGSYSPDDPGWMVSTTEPARNYLGRFGAALSSTLVILIGRGAWSIPLILAVWGGRFMLHRGSDRVLGRAVFAVIGVAAASAYASTLSVGADWPHTFGLGGLFGDTVAGALLGILPGSTGVGLILLSIATFFGLIAILLFVTGFDRAELRIIGEVMAVGSIMAFNWLLQMMGRGTANAVGSARAFADKRRTSRTEAAGAGAYRRQSALAEPGYRAAQPMGAGAAMGEAPGAGRRVIRRAPPPPVEEFIEEDYDDAAYHEDRAYGAPAMPARAAVGVREPLRAEPLRADPFRMEPLRADPRPQAEPVREKRGLLARMRRAVEPEPELIEPQLTGMALQAAAPEEDRIRARISDAIRMRAQQGGPRVQPGMSSIQAAVAARRRAEPPLMRGRGPSVLLADTRPNTLPPNTLAPGAEPLLRGVPAAYDAAATGLAAGQGAAPYHERAQSQPNLPMDLPEPPEARLIDDDHAEEEIADYRAADYRSGDYGHTAFDVPDHDDATDEADEPEVGTWEAPAPEVTRTAEPVLSRAAAPRAPEAPVAPARPQAAARARVPDSLADPRGEDWDRDDFTSYGSGWDRGEEIEEEDEAFAPPPPPSRPAPVLDRRAVVQNPVKKPVQPSARARSEAQPGLRFAEGPAHEFELPPLSLLAAPPASSGQRLSDEALEENARMLESVLDDYGVKGEIVSVRPGPVVTMYELEPAPGLKASRVIGLADDIARSMSALSARVSTVPGRSVIGIELPNAHREKVFLREILSSREFGDGQQRLPLALGKDIGGDPIVANLAKMPHLLIAGTTGSGKSVAINTMILSLLYKLTPEECRLIMIDPKMLELSVYDGIPHLLSPVVTDPKKAVVALKWVVGEMEERYRKMSKMGVRNIDGYNGRVREALARGEMFKRTIQTGFDDETGDPVFETEEFAPEPFPYIVVIVDEMADLMMVAGKEIEACIQRLAQMARASGIHLIMATQRPSVDVITGTIKANFPTRISFQVTSKIDSRTILGEQGAEQLLGQGDMLYMGNGQRITRIHGPFVSDEEVEEIVNHLKSFGPPVYMSGVVDGPDEDKADDIDAVLGLGGGNGDSEDALYDQAVAIVARDRKCSTSYIQRKLGIGYNKAARLVEQMEEEGVVTKANHVGKREILIPES